VLAHQFGKVFFKLVFRHLILLREKAAQYGKTKMQNTKKAAKAAESKIGLDSGETMARTMLPVAFGGLHSKLGIYDLL
jgi:hypothetical protein